MTDCIMDEPVNVLLVEDDEVDVEVIRRRFQRGNIVNPIYHAANGMDALEMLRGGKDRQKVPRPYIILLDINMPLMNGVEMLKELRNDKTLEQSIVFVLTTSPRDEDKAVTYKLNVAGYFLKKNVEELIEMLDLYWQINEFPGQDQNTAFGTA